MMSLGGKLKALACQQTTKVNKAEEITYLFTNIVLSLLLQLGLNEAETVKSNSILIYQYTDQDICTQMKAEYN